MAGLDEPFDPRIAPALPLNAATATWDEQMVDQPGDFESRMNRRFARQFESRPRRGGQTPGRGKSGNTPQSVTPLSFSDLPGSARLL